MPAVGAGATWIIGKVFIKHFTSGGTLLDFNPPNYREFLKMQRAKLVDRSNRRQYSERTDGRCLSGRMRRKRIRRLMRTMALGPKPRTSSLSQITRRNSSHTPSAFHLVRPRQRLPAAARSSKGNFE